MQNEIWQVKVKEQIYECAFAELEQWIKDRALLPHDEVRRGERSWVKAGRVPVLQTFFEAVSEPPISLNPSQTVAFETPAAETLAAKTLTAETVAPEPEFIDHKETAVRAKSFSPRTRRNVAPPPAEIVCSVHPEEATAYVCRECNKSFCKSCPKSFGVVKICPACGEMCRPFAEFQTKTDHITRQTNALAAGYGFDDFKRAWIYPFKFWQSLCFGAIFVAIFSLGGFFGFLISSMILFGCIAQTIAQTAHGESDKDFMPNFDDLDLLNDVVKPVFLCVGVWAISLGPMIILIGIFIYTGVSTYFAPPPASISTSQGNITISQKAAGTGVLPTSAEINMQEVQDSLVAQLTHEEMMAMVQGTDAEKLAVNQKLNQQMSSVQSEISDKMNQARPKTDYETVWVLATRLISSNFLLFLLLGFTIIWYFFYSPIALAIAGYTRSFTATINPLVGIDTIRRMGGVYLTTCGFCQIITLFSIGLTSGVAALTSPFDLPFYGNIPARFIASITGFYLSVVTAFVLGTALFHTSDKIGINSD